MLYIGHYSEDKKNGKGISLLEDNRIFKGNYINDVVNGYSKIYYLGSEKIEKDVLQTFKDNESKIVFEGNFKNGKKHGYGKVYWRQN